MLFRDVIGQHLLKNKLPGMMQSGKFPHAIMLLGPGGHGGLAMALAMAQYLHCENRQGDDSCGECTSCLKHQKMIHPDLYYTYPVIKPEKKKGPPVSADWIKEWRSIIPERPYISYADWMQSIGAENKQGNITADECREIIHHFNLKTFESSYKIQIIWLAEYLGNEGNILLKLIEEPPEGTVFLLVVEQLEQMLNTIISRTQIIKLPPIEDEALAKALQHEFEMTEDAAQRIVRIADGDYGTAASLATGEENLNDRLLHEWLVCCFNLKLKPSAENFNTLNEWIDNLAKAGRENQKTFIKYALFFLRECSMIAHTGTSLKLNEEEQQFAKRLSARLQTENFEQLLQLLNRAHYHIERNAHPKILFMSNSYKIASIFKQEPVPPDWA